MSHRSKAHFQQAVSSSLLGRKERTPALTTDDGTEKLKKRIYSCPRPDCPNEYKQLSGLKYHLAHVSPSWIFHIISEAHNVIFQGHREETLPTQLDLVPPALAKRVEEKLHGKASSPTEVR